MTEDDIKKLNFACGLEGGGHSFEAPPVALEGLGAVVWDGPDPDYVPWIGDGEFDFSDVQSPLYAFAPNSGHYDRTEWPAKYTDGDLTYVLLVQGVINETDCQCQCHGKLVPCAGEVGVAPALSRQDVLAICLKGIELPNTDGAVTWEFTGNVLDKPHPLCPHCEGDGYVDSPGGEWALYGALPEWEFDTEDATYIGDGTDGVYVQVQEYCNKYFAFALVDSESGHFTENLLSCEGPFESEEEAQEAGEEIAAEWCISNDVDPEVID